VIPSLHHSTLNKAVQHRLYARTPVTAFAQIGPEIGGEKAHHRRGQAGHIRAGIDARRIAHGDRIEEAVTVVAPAVLQVGEGVAGDVVVGVEAEGAHAAVGIGDFCDVGAVVDQRPRPRPGRADPRNESPTP
jgi:hypothetical protein